MAVAQRQVVGLGRVPITATPVPSGYGSNGPIAGASNVYPDSTIVLPADTENGRSLVLTFEASAPGVEMRNAPELLAQRVAVVRAAAPRPEILFLDGPFSALDPVTRADSQRWLVGVTADLGVTTVMVTHDVDESLVVVSRIALLGSAGRVQQEWTDRYHGSTESDPAGVNAMAPDLDVARTMGTSGWERLTRVVIPAVRPALDAAV